MKKKRSVKKEKKSIIFKHVPDADKILENFFKYSVFKQLENLKEELKEEDLKVPDKKLRQSSLARFFKELLKEQEE